MEPEYFLCVEKTKIVIRHSRNLLSLLLHSDFRNFTRLPKKQTHVKYYTVMKLVTKNKTGIVGIFFKLTRKNTKLQEKQISKLEKILLGKVHGLQNTQTY